MSLQSRLAPLISAIGADIKALTSVRNVVATSTERTPSVFTMPASSPAYVNAPADTNLQVTVIGGAGVSCNISPTGPAGTYTPLFTGTGVALQILPGESLRVSWTTTVPLVRTRVLSKIG